MLSIFIILSLGCERAIHKEYKVEELLYKINYFGDTLKNFKSDVKAYTLTGELFDEYHTVNGLKEGIEHAYYKDATLKWREYYSNNRKNGLCQYYYNNGVLAKAVIYKNDTINGYEVQFFANGSLREYSVSCMDAPIYVHTLDSIGGLVNNLWSYQIHYNKTLKAGEKFTAKFKVPVINGLNRDSDFVIGIYPNNVSSKDSDVICIFNNDYPVFYKGDERTRELKEIKVIRLKVDQDGNALFEYTPSDPGNYTLKGAVVYKGCREYLERKQKSRLNYPKSINIHFNVTENSRN